MSLLELFEELANNPHYDPDTLKIISSQPIEIRKAFELNNPDLLKKQFPTDECFAHSVKVII